MGESTNRKRTELSDAAEGILDDLELRFSGIADREVVLEHALRFLRWAHEEVALGGIGSFILLERPGKRPVDVSPMVLTCTGWSSRG